MPIPRKIIAFWGGISPNHFFDVDPSTPPPSVPGHRFFWGGGGQGSKLTWPLAGTLRRFGPWSRSSFALSMDHRTRGGVPGSISIFPRPPPPPRLPRPLWGSTTEGCLGQDGSVQDCAPQTHAPARDRAPASLGPPLFLRLRIQRSGWTPTRAARRPGPGLLPPPRLRARRLLDCWARCRCWAPGPTATPNQTWTT